MRTAEQATETDYYTETETCEHGKILDTHCSRCEELGPTEFLHPCRNCSQEYTCRLKKNRCCDNCRHPLGIRR
jgi:hypothetical protein